MGIGYLGSFVAVAMGFAFAESSFTQPADFWPLFVSIAVAFLLLSLPCFLFVHERGKPAAGPVLNWTIIRNSTRETLATLRSTQQYPGLLRFLIGRVFYTDAINTVIGFMGLFVMHVSAGGGLTQEDAATQRLIVMATAIGFAVPAGIVWGRVTDRLGPKRTLTGVLWLWMFFFTLTAAVAFFTLPVLWLYVIAILAGIAMAGTWAADRPYMLRLTPPDRIGEFYGLYGMVGRFSAITGPGLWALTTYLLVQLSGLPVLVGEGAAILVLLGMIVVSYRILRPVTDEPRNWEQLRARR